MKLENTSFSNYQLVLDELNTPIAVRIDGVDRYRLYDRVVVTDDGHGYISPGIKHGGIGTLAEIRRDNSDNFFGIRMDNGEFGFMKSARIKLK